MNNIKKIYELMKLKIRTNKKYIYFSVVFIFLYYLILIFGNFIEYKSYEDDIEKYDLVQYEELGFFIKDSTLNGIDDLIDEYKENEVLLDVASYLDLDTSEILSQEENIAQQNIELVQLIHTKDENYYYYSTETITTNYIDILILLVLIVVVMTKRKKILKFIYANASENNKLKIDNVLKYKKYIIILFVFLLTIFTIYFGSNLVEYKSYEEDINKYELTKYQNLGLLLKDSTLENIQVEIEKQKQLNSLIVQAEEMGISTNEILLPSITNTNDKIDIITKAIDDYEIDNSVTTNIDSDNDGVLDSNDVCSKGDDKVDENDNNLPDVCENSTTDELSIAEDNLSTEETTILYSESSEVSNKSDTSTVDMCDDKEEDCSNGEVEIDAPPTQSEECNPETKDCDNNTEIDNPPVEEVCDPVIEDCNNDGEINIPPVEEVCDPVNEDCNNDGQIDNPPVEEICDPNIEECMGVSNTLMNFKIKAIMEKNGYYL